jgi:hypothetical protein
VVADALGVLGGSSERNYKALPQDLGECNAIASRDLTGLAA